MWECDSMKLQKVFLNKKSQINYIIIKLFIKGLICLNITFLKKDIEKGYITTNFHWCKKERHKMNCFYWFLLILLCSKDLIVEICQWKMLSIFFSQFSIRNFSFFSLKKKESQKIIWYYFYLILTLVINPIQVFTPSFRMLFEHWCLL